MITINATFSQRERNLGLIGRRGENGTRQIAFDCSEVLAEYPDAKIICVFRRAGDREAYIAKSSMSGKTLTVDVTDADVAVPGVLQIELRVIVGQAVRKSATYTAQVDDSLRGEEDKPGNPAADLLNRLDATLKHAEDGVSAANQAAKAAQEIAETVQTKLENGELNGAKGDKGDPGNVQDVRVAGISVLKGGVANVPVVTADAPGVVSVLPPADSGIMNDNGSLKVSYATDTEISGRSGTRKAIVCANMDYAVKAAMCDGKGAAWTSAEQNAARYRMGIDKAYELIEEIVINESVTQVVRTNMSLAEMRITVNVPISDSTASVAIEVYSESTLIGYGYFGNLINKEHIKRIKFSVKRDCGAYVFSYVTIIADLMAQKAGVGTLNETASLFPVENAITKISLYSTSSSFSLPIGTKITIEGEPI